MASCSPCLYLEKSFELNCRTKQLSALNPSVIAVSQVWSKPVFSISIEPEQEWPLCSSANIYYEYLCKEQKIINFTYSNINAKSTITFKVARRSMQKSGKKSFFDYN